jgi:hypothetical protein
MCQYVCKQPFRDDSVNTADIYESMAFSVQADCLETFGLALKAALVPIVMLKSKYMGY